MALTTGDCGLSHWCSLTVISKFRFLFFEMALNYLNVFIILSSVDF